MKKEKIIKFNLLLSQQLMVDIKICAVVAHMKINEYICAKLLDAVAKEIAQYKNDEGK